MSSKKAKGIADQQLAFDVESAASGRGQQLKALKDVRLQDHYLRWILYVLDSYINQQLGYWDLTREDLAEACEMGLTTLDRKLKALKELGLIRETSLTNSRRKRFRIIRSTLDDLASECRRNRPVMTGEVIEIEEARSVSKASALCLRGRPDRQPAERNGMISPERGHHSPQREKSSPERGQTSPQRCEKSPQRENTILLTHTDIHRPLTDTPSEAAAVAASLNQLLIECGVTHPAKAVRSALKSGADPVELVAIVDHWKQCHESAGYGPPALQWRIRNHVPGLKVSEGWPKPKRPIAAPVASGEQLAELDGLQDSEITEAILASGNAALVFALKELGSVQRLLNDPERRTQVAKCIARTARVRV